MKKQTVYAVQAKATGETLSLHVVYDDATLRAGSIVAVPYNSWKHGDLEVVEMELEPPRPELKPLGPQDPFNDYPEKSQQLQDMEDDDRRRYKS